MINNRCELLTNWSNDLSFEGLEREKFPVSEKGWKVLSNIKNLSARQQVTGDLFTTIKSLWAGLVLLLTKKSSEQSLNKDLKLRSAELACRIKIVTKADYLNLQNNIIKIEKLMRSQGISVQKGLKPLKELLYTPENLKVLVREETTGKMRSHLEAIGRLLEARQGFKDEKASHGKLLNAVSYIEEWFKNPETTKEILQKLHEANTALAKVESLQRYHFIEIKNAIALLRTITGA